MYPFALQVPSIKIQLKLQFHNLPLMCTLRLATANLLRKIINPDGSHLSADTLDLQMECKDLSLRKMVLLPENLKGYMEKDI